MGARLRLRFSLDFGPIPSHVTDNYATRRPDTEERSGSSRCRRTQSGSARPASHLAADDLWRQDRRRVRRDCLAPAGRCRRSAAAFHAGAGGVGANAGRRSHSRNGIVLACARTRARASAGTGRSSSAAPVTRGSTHYFASFRPAYRVTSAGACYRLASPRATDDFAGVRAAHDLSRSCATHDLANIGASNNIARLWPAHDFSDVGSSCDLTERWSAHSRRREPISPRASGVRSGNFRPRPAGCDAANAVGACDHRRVAARNASGDRKLPHQDQGEEGQGRIRQTRRRGTGTVADRRDAARCNPRCGLALQHRWHRRRVQRSAASDRTHCLTPAATTRRSSLSSHSHRNTAMASAPLPGFAMD